MNKKILVIDDEEIIIKSFAKLLEKSTYEVFIAKSGRDALIMNEEENFDLIICDMRMPGINGVETVKSIYKILKNRGLNKPPLIFITGYADKKSEKEAFELNPAAYIYKPFDIADVLNQIKKVLQQ
jgi:CheY-like chemotaxis protein